MLHLIYGCPGSGKSRLLSKMIASRLRAGADVIYLVPERFSVLAEEEVTAVCRGLNLMNLDVLSFKRLCNRAFREYGGICYNYAGRGGQILVMLRALSEVRGELGAYGKAGLSDKGTVEAILDGIVSFKRAALTPEDFENASKRCSSDAQLAAKAGDLSKIWRAYDRLLGELYDDPEEDLARLYRLLVSTPFLEGKELFVQSSGAFTGQEMKILEAAIARCPHVTVALDLLPETEDDRPMLSKIRRVEKLLEKAAMSACVPFETAAVLRTPEDKNADLVSLEKLLYSEKKPGVPLSGGLELAVYDSIYEECRAIAAKILCDVQNGGRFMDHAVVLRDLAAYQGIIDQVFEANGVPCTVKARTRLSDLAAGRLLLLALRLNTANYRLEDLIDYMKTGLSGVEDLDCFALEDYANLWQIEGASRWLSDGEFQMNPSGHLAERTGEDFKKLKELNAIRERLCAPLRQLREDIDAAATVRDRAAVLFEYIVNMDLERRLREEAEEAETHGSGYEAQMLSQTFPAICGVLDELVYAAGDLRCRPEEFQSMFEILMEKKELAGIPEGKDRVLISDAYSLKADGVKTLYAAGMNEGVFPACVRTSGMFTAREASALRALEVDLPGDETRETLDEEYLCYCVLTLPREKLCVSSHRKDLRGQPAQHSELYEELCALKGKTPRQTFDEGFDRALLYGRANCLERALSAGKDEDTAALRALFKERSGEQNENLQNAPLVKASESVDASTVEAIYGDGPLSLSQSGIEAFLNCPMSYTCKYLLRLRETPKKELGYNEIGTAVHAVFERLIGECIAKREDFGALTDGEVKERVRAIVSDLSSEAFDRGEPSAELAMAFRRIRQIVTVLAYNLRDEFASGSFAPAFCELHFGTDRNNKGILLPAVAVRDADGNEQVRLHGIADRVDVYRSGNKIYLRVVDYKTGNKEFIPEAVEKGMNLQMLLYLKALKACRDPRFLAEIGAKPGDVVEPAGVFYFNAKRDDAKKVSKYSGAAAIRAAVYNSIKRSGMLIDDPEVVHAMEHSGAGVFIPMDNGRPKNAVPLETFNEKLEGLDVKLSEVAKKMRAGISDACPKNSASKKKDPVLDKSRSGCEYCKMAPVCRSKTVNSEEEDD